MYVATVNKRLITREYDLKLIIYLGTQQTKNGPKLAKYCVMYISKNVSKEFLQFIIVQYLYLRQAIETIQ